MRATPPQFIRVKDYFPLDPCTERWRRWRPQRSSAHPTRAVRRQVAATNAIASHPEFPVRNMVVPPVVDYAIQSRPICSSLRLAFRTHIGALRERCATGRRISVYASNRAALAGYACILEGAW
jgi:hypothetical protein